MKQFSIITLLIISILGASSACNKKQNVWDKKDYGGAAPVQGKQITVYRSATCGCCKKWLTHLEKHGFVVQDHIVQDMNTVKKEHGVSPRLASCHTGIVDGYVIEGHVPAQDIVRLLAAKPKDIAGLTVPAMPVGTPGMEGKDREGRDRKDPFAVISFSKDGKAGVYRRYTKY